MKDWVYKYVGGLFMEEKKGKMIMSLGRVVFVMIVAQMMIKWGLDKPLGDGMLSAFYGMSGYIFGTKLTSAMTARVVGKVAETSTRRAKRS